MASRLGVSHSRIALPPTGGSPHTPSTSIGTRYHGCSVEERQPCLADSEGVGPGLDLVLRCLPSPRPKQSRGLPYCLKNSTC